MIDESSTPSAPQREFLPAERQDAILTLLTRNSVVKVTELAQLLNTTEITIRRDLTQLADQGLIKRVRGGAMSISVPETITSGIITDAANNAQVIESQQNMTTGTIGVMLPEPSFLWPRVNTTISQIAARTGFAVTSVDSTYDDFDETAQLDTLAQLPDLAGLIIAPNTHEDVKHSTWEWIKDLGIPTVVVERSQPEHMDFFTDSVCTDHQNGARKAYWHFKEHGHARVAAAFSSTPTSDLIERGWRNVVEENDGLTSPIIKKHLQAYEVDRIESLAKEIINENITGLLAHSDYLAIAIMQALQRHGAKVPEDVSIISVDGFATISSRPLTVLRTFPEALGTEAFNLLQWRLQNPHSTARHLWIDPELIDRGSVHAINGVLPK